MRTIVIIALMGLFGWANGVFGQNGIEIRGVKEKFGRCDSDTASVDFAFFVRNDIVKVEIQGEYFNGAIIYQPASQKVWTLDYNGKYYYVSTESELAEINQQFDSLIAAMDEVSARSEQPTVWESDNPTNDKIIVEQAKVKEGDTVLNGFLCTRHEQQMKSGAEVVVWNSRLKEINAKKKEFHLLHALIDLFDGKLTMMLGNYDFSEFKYGKSGFPLVNHYHSFNLHCATWTARSVQRVQLDDELFTIPTTFGKFENPYLTE